MNYPHDELDKSVAEEHRQEMLYVPTQNVETNSKHRFPSLYAWTWISVILMAILLVLSVGYLITHQSSTTSHKLNLRPAATKVVAPQPVAPSLKPAEKIAKQLGGTDIVGSSKSEMQSLNTGDSAGIVADYATFQMNGTKYIVLLFTGPTTKSVAELGFAEAGMGDAAYSGPTWDVYTKAQWDKAKSAANA